MDYTDYYRNLNSASKTSTPSNKTTQTLNRPVQPVTVLCSPDNPYVDVDYAREQNYDALTELIEKTTSSKDTYSETISSFSQAVVNALDPYTEQTPIATSISSCLSGWLNTDEQSGIDTYDSAIQSCTTTREYV